MNCTDAFHFNPDWIPLGLCVILGLAGVVALIGLVRVLIES